MSYLLRLQCLHFNLQQHKLATHTLFILTALPLNIMSTEKLKPVKRLQEFLQEQQEPFILEMYLVERRHLIRRLNKETSSGYDNENPRKILTGSANNTLNRSKRDIFQYFKILNDVFDQFISNNRKLQKIKSSDNELGKVDLYTKGINDQLRAEVTIPTAICRTSCNPSTTIEAKEMPFTVKSCSRLGLYNHTKQKDSAKRAPRWRDMEDFKQIRPVPVLKDIPSSRVYNCRFEELSAQKTEIFSGKYTDSPIRVKESSTLSASLWKILFGSVGENQEQAGAEGKKDLSRPNLSSQYWKCETILQHRKQVMFDWFKEFLHSHDRKQKSQLGFKQIGRLDDKRIKLFRKESGNESNLTNLLALDISTQAWSSYESQSRGIGLDIEDVIFREISSEIVLEMLNYSTN